MRIGGVDKNGCPKIGCSMVSRCPPKMLGCPPETKQTVVGKDKTGCPKHACCVIKLLGCKPGTIATKIGEDKSGCPLHECRHVACPDIKCPPFAKMRIGGVDKNGCPKIGCSMVSRCPPYLLGCKQGTKQTVVGLDERECPKFACCAIKVLGCKPGLKPTRVGKDENGCPKFECKPAIPSLWTSPSTPTVKWNKGRGHFYERPAENDWKGKGKDLGRRINDVEKQYEKLCKMTQFILNNDFTCNIVVSYLKKNNVGYFVAVVCWSIKYLRQWWEIC